MSTENVLPFLPVDELGPLFATGFLAATTVTALGCIITYHTVSSFKDVLLVRTVSMGFFLLAVLFFVGGQTSALTFTAVSLDCSRRNIVLTLGDQFARISAIIVGLNILSRARYRWAKLGLYAWALVRLVVGIIQAALVRREGGVVCLPAPNIVPSAIGMTLDLGLDLFLIYRAIRLFLKSEQDQRHVETIVVASTAAISIWHFSSIPMLFRIAGAGGRIIPYCIFLSILIYVLTLFYIRVPTPNYVVLPFHNRTVITSPLPDVPQMNAAYNPKDKGPKLVRDLFSAFRNDSTTSINGAPTEPDTEPPLQRYAVAGPQGVNTYNIVKLPSSHNSLDSFGPRPAPRRVDGLPHLPPLKIPPVAPRLDSIRRISGLLEPDEPGSATSWNSSIQHTPRPKSTQSTAKTDESSLLAYPVTTMPMPTVPPVLVRKASKTVVVSSKAVAKPLPVNTSNNARTDEMKSDDEEFDVVVRKMVDSSFVNSPTPDDTPRSSLHKSGAGGKDITLKDLPPMPPAEILSQNSPPSLKLRERIPATVKAQLSKDLASARDPELSSTDQTAVYTDMLALLSEAISDTQEDEHDMARSIEAIRISLTEKGITDGEMERELDNLSRSIRKSQKASKAVQNVYETLSSLPQDAALAVLREYLGSPQDSTLPSIEDEDPPFLSDTSMTLEKQSPLEQRLHKKLSEYEDPESADSLRLPNIDTRSSESSMQILSHLEEEFVLVGLNLQASQRDSDISSSVSSLGDRSAPATSPAWRPSAKTSAAAERVTKYKESHTYIRDTIISVDEGLVVELTDTDSVTRADESTLPLHTSSPVPSKSSVPSPAFSETKPLVWKKSPDTVQSFSGYDTASKGDMQTYPSHAPSHFEGKSDGTSSKEIQHLWRPEPPIESITLTPGLWSRNSAGITSVRRAATYDASGSRPKWKFVPRDESLVSYRDGSGLWKPKETSISSLSLGALGQASQNDQVDSHTINEKRSKLWTPSQPVPLVRSTTGLWKRDSERVSQIGGSENIESIGESVRYSQSASALEQQIQEGVIKFAELGLWKKPIVASQAPRQGIWNRKQNENTFSNEQGYDTFKGQETSANDMKREAARPNDSILDPKMYAYLRVMKFKFPLPPLSTPSPPHSSPQHTSDGPPNSIDSDEPVHSRQEAIASTDPARTHPAFIGSDLRPENGPFHDCQGEYPIERLNPICMGYFNNREYEIAMASIRAAEEIYHNRSLFDAEDTSFEKTLQRRRSERRGLGWGNRSAKLSVNIDLISAHNALASAEKIFSRSQLSSRRP